MRRHPRPETPSFDLIREIHDADQFTRPDRGGGGHGKPRGRRFTWRSIRGWLLLVALAAGLCWAAVQRTVAPLRRAANEHADLARVWAGLEARYAPGSYNRELLIRRERCDEEAIDRYARECHEMVEHHRLLREKYDAAVLRPWSAVEPDPEVAFPVLQIPVRTVP